MTGRMVSKWPGKCLECEHVWIAGDMIFYNEGRVGYYCSESCARSVVEPVGTQTPSEAQYTPPTANFAVNEATERSRAIHEAHMENMAANDRLVRAIDLQTAVCDDLRAELAKIAKCMQDEYLARHGVKV